VIVGNQKMCLFESDLESKKKKDFSFGLLLLLLCGREMGVNDGARLGRKEEEKLCVVEDQKKKKKMAAPTQEGEGGNPGRSRNPPLLHVILFHFFFLLVEGGGGIRKKKGETISFCRCLFDFIFFSKPQHFLSP
jgi:hypothetical protein